MKETIHLRDLVSKRKRRSNLGIELHIALKTLHQVQPVTAFDTFRPSLDDNLEDIEARKTIVDFSNGGIVGRVRP
mgnify:CR=1 FL=1